MSDSRSRKWQITINNPAEHGFTHERINEALDKLGVDYRCMSDEIGNQTHTPHTQFFICRENAIRFSTLQKLFPGAHLEIARGTSQENRDYIFKEGKWLTDEKGKTNLRDTHFEQGEMPVERQGARNDLADLHDMIKSGMSNAEIFEECPHFILQSDKIDRARTSILQDKYKDTWRDLDVTYISGPSGVGKTRFVMDKFGYSNVYRVTDYSHPFDGYNGQDVLLLDEFRTSLPFSFMLNLLDGYPLQLPARYSNKQAQFTKVFVISNRPFDEQYPEYQEKHPEDFEAFRRRFHHFIVMGNSDGFVPVGDTELPIK